MCVAGRMALMQQNAQMVASPKTQFLVSLSCLVLHAYGLRLCTQECSVCSVAETLFTVHKHAQAHTQTRANSQRGRVDRVSELWLQAYSVCFCVYVLFLAIRWRLVQPPPMVVSPSPSPVHIT